MTVETLKERADHARYSGSANMTADVAEAVLLVLAELAALRLQAQRLEAVEADLQKERRAHLQTIDERDAAQDAADKLAYSVAPMEAIGEHSNMNDPWANALEHLDAERTQHSEALGRMQVSFSAEEQRAEAAEAQLQAHQDRVQAVIEKLIPMANASPYNDGYHCVFCKMSALLRHDDDCPWLLVTLAADELQAALVVTAADAGDTQ